jgi:hypothetical protein
MPGLENVIVQFATAVNSQVAEARTVRVVRELEYDQPVLPSTKFELLFQSLLNLLNVDSEQDLPNFWFRFAASKKKQEFATVRDCLETYARGTTAFCPFAPIPTPKLLSDLSTLTFVGDHPDDLKTGIQPFMAMDGSEEFQAAAQDLARSYSVMVEQDLGISYTDLDRFKLPKDLRAHPSNHFELEKSLGIFGNRLGTILGERHPLTMHYRDFWKTYSSEFKGRFHHVIDIRRVIKPVHILRSLQLVVFKWFSTKKLHRAPADPPLLDILDRLSLHLYTNPTLPPALYQAVYQKNQKTPLIPGQNTIVSDDASTTSAVSALTSATGLTGTSRYTSTTSRYDPAVTNPHPDPNLQALLPATVRIKDLLGTDKAPKNEANSPMCLSYHIRGICFANCRRLRDHDRPLTVADKNILLNWVVDQLAKRRAAGAIPP